MRNADVKIGGTYAYGDSYRGYTRKDILRPVRVLAKVKRPENRYRGGHWGGRGYVEQMNVTMFAVKFLDPETLEVTGDGHVKARDLQEEWAPYDAARKHYEATKRDVADAVEKLTAAVENAGLSWDITDSFSGDYVEIGLTPDEARELADQLGKKQP